MTCMLLFRVGLVWGFSSALVRGDNQNATDIFRTATDDSTCTAIASRGEIVVDSSHVIGAMRRGWWGCAEVLGRAAADSGVVDIEKYLSQESRTYVNKLSALRSILESAQPPTQIISPALQWAQSGDSIFMNVKFAHKIDAPATLNSVIRAVNLTNHSLYLYAIKERKAFELNLTFFGAINPDDSSWNTASVGRMVLTIRKADAPIAWPTLLSGDSKKMHNIHMWWDKAEEFSDEIDDLRENGGKRAKTAPKKSMAKSSSDNSSKGASKKDAKQKTKPAVPSKKTAMEKASEDVAGSLASKLPDVAERNEKESTAEKGTTKSISSTEGSSPKIEKPVKRKLTPKEKSYETIDEEMYRKIRKAEEKAQSRKRDIEAESKQKRAAIDAKTAETVEKLKTEAAKLKAELREKYGIVEETEKDSLNTAAEGNADEANAADPILAGRSSTDEL